MYGSILDKSDVGTAKEMRNDNSSSEEDSDLESCLAEKIGLLIEKKFANIVIQGGQKPKKITRVDQIMDYSRVILE